MIPFCLRQIQRILIQQWAEGSTDIFFIADLLAKSLDVEDSILINKPATSSAKRKQPAGIIPQTRNKWLHVRTNTQWVSDIDFFIPLLRLKRDAGLTLRRRTSRRHLLHRGKTCDFARLAGIICLPARSDVTKSRLLISVSVWARFELTHTRAAVPRTEPSRQEYTPRKKSWSCEADLARDASIPKKVSGELAGWEEREDKEQERAWGWGE